MESNSAKSNSALGLDCPSFDFSDYHRRSSTAAHRWPTAGRSTGRSTELDWLLCTVATGSCSRSHGLRWNRVAVRRGATMAAADGKSVVDCRTVAGLQAAADLRTVAAG